MGVASLVLGIVSIVIGFVPFCGAIAFIPAIIGLILGIVEIVKKNKANEAKGMAIAGTVLSAIAILVIIYWVFIAGMAGAALNASSDELVKALNEIGNNALYY